jgi:enoyl-CoA hydratase/carnithine racemase
MSDRVTISTVDGVADVRLNRADKMNALDPAMFAAIIEAGEAVRADPSVRAVVLSGEGRAFCAGLDFSSFAAMAGDGVGNGAGDGADRPALPRIEQPADSPVAAAGQHAVYVWRMIEAPVIAAVHGHALGGGFQLALGADIRIVAPDVKMSVLEIRWGLVPDMCGTQLLPELVGLDVAKELTFTGRMIDGHEAVRLGVATRVSDAPRDDALALAAEIATKSPQATKGAKALLEMAGHSTLADGFAAEQRIIRALIGSPNQVEAVKAFFDKRPPKFAD